MKYFRFLIDHKYILLIHFGVYAIILLFLIAFKLDIILIVIFTLLEFLSLLISITIEYMRKKKFYDALLENVKGLDQAYLVLETLERPSFYEGELIYETLYDIDKSMSENVEKHSRSLNDFKEYLELWIHEVKIPLASLTLMTHNHKELKSKTSLEQIHKIDAYIEQVLYYVRQETPEKDYLIKEVDLANIIPNVAIKNKDDILSNDIALIASNPKGRVYTDSKWLEFILGQIINNAIKYKDDKKEESYIKIWTEVSDNILTLYIEDNGIGIPSSDLARVFDKSFTGQNGRRTSASTGMGLYIVKNLLQKLGHTIEIASVEGKYTRLAIHFFQNEFYKVVK